MIERYLDTSNALRVVFLLVDIRHEPTAKDVETYQMLFKKGFNPLIIATKADKIKKNARNKKYFHHPKETWLVTGSAGHSIFLSNERGKG